MEILLFRHGIAIDRADPACPPDAERALTNKGRKRTKAAARGIKILGYSVDQVISSPFVRARQTADIAAAALGVKGDVRVTDALLWDAEPARLRTELSELAARAKGPECVLCAGHAPHLDVFLAHMLGVPPITELKKAGLAILESGFTEPGDASLVAVYPPRALRALAG